MSDEQPTRETTADEEGPVNRAPTGNVGPVLLPAVAALPPERRVFALERARGATVADAVRAAGITRRQTGSEWEADPAVRAAVEALQAARYDDPRAWLDELVPHAVEGLRAAVEKGEEWAIRDVLDRRYGKAVARTEVSGPGGGPVEVTRRDTLLGKVMLLAGSVEGGP